MSYGNPDSMRKMLWRRYQFLAAREGVSNDPQLREWFEFWMTDIPAFEQMLKEQLQT